MNTSDIIPSEFKNKIINELILPSYRTNIEYIIKTRTCWSIVSKICLTASTLLIGLSSLLSFSSSNYPDNNLNYYAGAVGVISIIAKEFSAFASNQDHIKTLEVNNILKNLNINFLMEDETALINENKRTSERKMNQQNPLLKSNETNKDSISTDILLTKLEENSNELDKNNLHLSEVESA